jgi:hypothetical protein
VWEKERETIDSSKVCVCMPGVVCLRNTKQDCWEEMETCVW